MGCEQSSQKVHAEIPMAWQQAGEGETLVAALARLDEDIAGSERTHPAARLAVVSAELDSIQQEIKSFEETTSSSTSKDSYAKTLHQVFVSLDLYRRPVLASENEDFVANINRKEMRRLELSWLHTRHTELQRERRALHAQILRTRALYAQLQHLLDSVWSHSLRPGTPLEDALARARALRDALATVSARLRAAAEYAHAAVRMLDDGLPAWKLSAVGKSGWERTAACADACRLLVQARCLERGARRVLSAPAAPRAARTLRLALDYAFTDTLHDYKYQRATEVFVQFKEALVQLINSIHQSLQKRKASTDVEIFINSKSVSVPSYYTALQALKRERVTIPSFCFHERLSVAGNCRMCIIEVEGMWKPQIACALNVWKGMKIRTNSDIAFKAQESVLEFILVDHPLDCPICDQGGECDLQDLSMKFGNDRTRFADIHFEGKRAVESKDLGPLINTEMNRCIHCTRCIRFAAQVCGLDVLGTTGRGHHMLVGTYVEKEFYSELSGNIIDLCPVGALTSIPYRFKARPWEVRRTNSIDVTDATGTNIEINSRYNRVLRLLPRENAEVNQEWLSDRGRWAVDSVEMQRLVTPMIRMGTCLCPIEWDVALNTASQMIKKTTPDKVVAIAGPHTNVETLVAAKDFINTLGGEHTYIERNFKFTRTGVDIRAAYSMCINMKDVAKADKIILVGTNPRFEAPVLNAWIRQAYRNNECDIYVIGPVCEYNYHVTYIGGDANCLGYINDILCGAQNPIIFVGVDQLGAPRASDVMAFLTKYSYACTIPDWKVLNVIGREASMAGALEAGWNPGGLAYLQEQKPDVLISLGADEIFYDWNPCCCDVIYIGFQGDRGAENASLVLPGAAYTEAGGVYLNTECRSQIALPAVSPPGKAMKDWKIIRAIAEYTGVCLSYSDLPSLHVRMGQISPNFSFLGNYQEKLFGEMITQMPEPLAGCEAPTLDVDLKTLQDYYCADVFSFNSPTMIKTQKAYMKFLATSYHQI